MIFRPFYAHETGCASYLFGCGSQGLCAVVDPLAAMDAMLRLDRGLAG